MVRFDHYRRECNLHWAAIIYRFLADGDEDAALEMLFGLLKEYVRDMRKGADAA